MLCKEQVEVMNDIHEVHNTRTARHIDRLGTALIYAEDDLKAAKSNTVKGTSVPPPLYRISRLACRGGNRAFLPIPDMRVQKRFKIIFFETKNIVILGPSKF